MSVYEEARARIRGLALNLPTPFRGTGYAIDTDGLRRNLECYMDAGVPIILLTYGTSGFYVLSEEEIRLVTRMVVETVAGRAFVVAATGRWWLGQAVDFAHFCEQVGADCLMVTKLHPSWVRSDPDILDHHRELARCTRIPLMFHNECVGPASVDLAEAIADIEHVVAMKQELADYDQYVALAQRVCGRIAVVSGAGAPLAHWAHQFGVSASLTGVGQWAPGPEARYVEHLLAGHEADARKHLDIILPYRLLARRLNNHAAIKFAMDIAGLAGGPCRPPGANLTDEHRSRLAPVIRQTLRDLGMG